jgi:putative transposase
MQDMNLSSDSTSPKIATTTLPKFLAAKRKAYPSDLSDAQWEMLQPFVDVDKSKIGPNPAIHDRREIVNAILYQTRTGCQWRYLPHDLPDWQSVYHYFRLWAQNGTLKSMHDSLRELVRVAAGRQEQPTAAVLDSQSVKTTEVAAAESRGYDAGKKVKGRKRHLLVDTIGMVLMLWVSTADVQDRDSVKAMFPKAAEDFPFLKLVWVDGGYQGPIAAKAGADSGIKLEVVKRTDNLKGFKLLPRRWVVERTFGWLNRERRLSKDYERTNESSEAFVYWSMTALMVRRVA